MPSKGGKSLTQKQAAFVREYLIDLNAAAAARRAGFADSVANSRAPEWVGKVRDDCPAKYQHVWDAVHAALAKRAEKAEINAKWVLERAVELVDRTMQKVEPVLTMSGKQALDPETKRPLFKFDGKVATSALKLVGEHIDIQAFKKQVEVSGQLDIAEIMWRHRRGKGKLNEPQG